MHNRAEGAYIYSMLQTGLVLHSDKIFIGHGCMTKGSTKINKIEVILKGKKRDIFFFSKKDIMNINERFPKCHISYVRSKKNVLPGA